MTFLRPSPVDRLIHSRAEALAALGTAVGIVLLIGTVVVGVVLTMRALGPNECPPLRPSFSELG